MVRQFFIFFAILASQLNAQGFDRKFLPADSISPNFCNYTTWSIDFVFDKADILSSSKLIVLDSLTFILKQDTGLVIEIGVHSGLRGSDEYNNTNTLSRAETIKAYLIKQGIKPAQLMAKGYGKTTPLEITDKNSPKKTNCDGDSFVDKNRRIEFKMINGLCDGNLNQWKLYPLTIDRLGKFPYKIDVVGAIIEVSPGLECGVLCGSGTIRVKFNNTVEGYDGTEVFIALPCSGIGSYGLNKTIRINVKQLTIDNDDCFWNSAVHNRIDSKGYPFYIPADLNGGWKLE